MNKWACLACERGLTEKKIYPICQITAYLSYTQLHLLLYRIRSWPSLLCLNKPPSCNNCGHFCMTDLLFSVLSPKSSYLLIMMVKWFSLLPATVWFVFVSLCASLLSSPFPYLSCSGNRWSSHPEFFFVTFACSYSEDCCCFPLMPTLWLCLPWYIRKLLLWSWSLYIKKMNWIPFLWDWTTT